ncbi:girdin-like [Rhodamnia argentea]|uniref:FRIGIDA-like protein n=1 Tax=Rhodamnia argentea TaxID=178133 RepID=A0A8B8NG13_9MYRT|nr:girdin-like [Rhodamnia argentea]
MEKISGELTRAELKKENLFKAYEQAHSQASSVLSFSLQWKDLEEHFDGIRRSLERRAEELDQRERELAERAARDVASREEGLRSARQIVEEWEEEVRRKKMDLRSVEEVLEKCRDGHREVEKQLVVKHETLRECTSLIRDKKNQLSTIKQKTEECGRDYDSKKVEVEVLRQELDSMEKKVGEVRSLLKENVQELHVKAGELGTARLSLEECSRAVESKESQLHSINILIEKHKEELESKKTELEEINMSINEWLTELALKDKELGSIESCIGKKSEELNSKEGELENMTKRVKQCKQETESKKEDLASVQAKLEEVAKSLQLKSREFNAVQASIKDHNLELASKKSQLESIEVNITQRAEQLLLKEQEYASIQTSTLECTKVLESKRKQCSLGSTRQWQIKTEEPENFAGHNADYSSVEYRPPPTILARNCLQLFQIELSNENAMLCKEISHTLQNSSDPAKLVLDVIAGSCTQSSNSRDMNLQTDVRRSHIILLEQLVSISPSITREVKERALKLAREWNAKLSDRPKSALEVLAFQRFLVAYDLLSLSNDAPLFGQILALVNEITGASPASTMYTPTFEHQKVFPTQCASKQEVGHKGISNPEKDRPDVFRKTQVRPEKVNKKRNRRQVVESSESYDSGSSSESDEDSVIFACGNFQGSQNYGLPCEQSIRRSTRQKQQVSYRENLSDDEDTNPAKSSKGGSPSSSTEEEFDLDGKDGLA